MSRRLCASFSTAWFDVSCVCIGLYLLLTTVHVINMMPANGAVRLALHIAQAISALVYLGVAAAGLYKTDAALATVPPPEFQAFLLAVNPSLATILKFASSLKAVRGWLIYALACASSAFVAACLLLALSVRPALRKWPSRTGRHTGAYKADVAVSSVLAGLLLAAAAVAAAKVKCTPGTFDGFCDILNTANAFSWINFLLWAVSAVLAIRDLMRATAPQDSAASMENGVMAKSNGFPAAHKTQQDNAVNLHTTPIMPEGGVPATGGPAAKQPAV